MNLESIVFDSFLWQFLSTIGISWHQMTLNIFSFDENFPMASEDDKLICHQWLSLISKNLWRSFLRGAHCLHTVMILQNALFNVTCLFWCSSSCTVLLEMQIAPSRTYLRSGPKLKHIDRCGCHLYYQRFCNGYSAPKSINQCLYITMEIGPYSCFWYIKFPWGRGYFHSIYIYITMGIGPCQWEVNIAFYWIRGYFHSNIYRKHIQ